MAALGDYTPTVYVTGDTITAIKLNNNETATDVIDANLKYLTVTGTTLTYTSNVLTEVLETVASVNYQRTTLTYTSGALTGVNVKRYATNGSTIISEWNEVLSYTSGALTGVAKTIVT